MNGSMYRRIAAVIVSLPWATAVFAADRTTVKDFIIEPPTLVSLGFEWRIDGDDNRNAIGLLSQERRADLEGGLATPADRERADQRERPPVRDAKRLRQPSHRSGARD